jgi:hypothetical protein
VIPPQMDAEFVCAMEQVLDVYEKPLDVDHPVVCVDEASRQLIEEIALPIPMEPGQPERFDYEYKRNGTVNLFVAFQPLLGFREVVVTDRRTAMDFAAFLKYLVDVIYFSATRLTIVLDNLNTHKLSVLYDAYSPEEAHRIMSKLEFVHTPKHGSWLNMAELEFAAIQGQCLDRRIATKEELTREVDAWRDKRNDREVRANWQFKTEDARIILRKLYPDNQPI